ncbi:Chymotrypsin-like serine proteinase,Trypsin delta [Mytilus coruscus]|uniref:Chymotrypsin-like serine proteinase,Trypsin delta n=1 Tax=Mytilus coruscus TaxID=42192 RepID=A0A6J8CWB1_MYTCO|nr:Chymotrypsin-like serine proteinase,Trypsin delta [Mytilus coruscus]
MEFIFLLCIIAIANGGVVPNGDEVSNAAKRIVGGQDTTINKHAWQVSLQRKSGTSWSHSCGGSIIGEKWVVTAAHCVEGSPVSSLRIAAGSTTWNSGGETRLLSSFTMHPDYDGFGDGFPNDIAVLELESALPFSSSIAKIEMADDEGDFAGDKCMITGWGLTNDEPGLPDVLQEVTMTVLSNTDCTDRWSTVTGADINGGHICIGNDQDSGKSACNGDSGGPMQCELQGTTYLAGATSWGISGCGVGYPSVYTRISFFRNWIRQQTGI